MTNVDGRMRRMKRSNPTSVLLDAAISEEEKTTYTFTGQKIDILNNQKCDTSLLQKLFSSKEEETFVIPHIHKILGLSCLGSFAYRLAHVGGSDGNFGPHFGTLAFIALHLSLNLSAFIFAIPHRRIRDGGFRIWPEYRIHSLVFTSRSLAFMLLLWYEQKHNIRANSRHCYYSFDLLIVLATCAAADFGSYLQGEHRSNTVRGATFSDPFEQWFASEMQLYLTAFCLIGYRRYTVHLIAVLVIQTTSFLLTLRRKNAAPQRVLTACYSLMLLISFVAIVLDDQFTYRTLVGATFGSVAAILRMGPLHLNKYVLWTLLGAAFCGVRISRRFSIYNDLFWLEAFCITHLIATLLGVYQRSKAPKETKSPVAGFVVFAGHVLFYGYLYVVNFVWNWY